MPIQMPTARWKCDGDSFIFRHHLPTNVRYYVDAFYAHSIQTGLLLVFIPQGTSDNDTIGPN